MLDGKRYLAEFPDEDPARRAFLHSPKVIATLRALEKELRPYIPRLLDTGVVLYLPGRISATNCETLAKFSPQTTKPKGFVSK